MYSCYDGADRVRRRKRTLQVVVIEKEKGQYLCSNEREIS
jgi:hypothetical protein